MALVISNDLCIISKSNKILYITFCNRSREMMPSISFFIAYSSNFFRETSLYRVLYFFSRFSWVYKVVASTEADTWDKILVIFTIRVTSTGIFFY